MNVSEFMEKTKVIKTVGSYSFQEVRPRIVCQDGFSLSVQGSRTHYCKPREDDCSYFKVEIGYPSEKVDEFMQYAEDENDPTNTVYGYVPIETVETIVAKHGGIADK